MNSIITSCWGNSNLTEEYSATCGENVWEIHTSLTPLPRVCFYTKKTLYCERPSLIFPINCHLKDNHVFMNQAALTTSSCFQLFQSFRQHKVQLIQDIKSVILDFLNFYTFLIFKLYFVLGFFLICCREISSNSWKTLRLNFIKPTCDICRF